MFTELMHRGGPIMWPLLVTSIVAITVVIERLLFIWRHKRERDPRAAETILAEVERNDLAAAIQAGENSRDFVARVLAEALKHGEESLSGVLMRASTAELKQFGRGLPVLDTAITLAPLLGLLGTVTGMIRAFRIVGGDELGTPLAITGGVAEALIATAFGLGIAIVALIPFNYLNARMEAARHDLEDAGSHLELLIIRRRSK